MSDSRTEIDIPESGLVPETIAPEAPEGDRVRSPREVMMDKIAARVNASREAELRVGEEMTSVARDSGLTFDTYVEPDASTAGDTTNAPAPSILSPRRTAPQPLSEPPSEGSADLQASPSTPAAPPAPDLFLVDVGGQQIHVSREQLIELARMGAIANRTVHDFQQQQMGWNPTNYSGQGQGVNLLPTQTGEVRGNPEPPPVNRDKVRDVVKRLQYSSEDDATESLAGLIGDVVSQNRPTAPPIDQRAWINEASQETIRTIEARRVVETIKQEYPDIVGNADYSHMAFMKAQQIRQELASLGRQATDLQVFREAGDRVRSLFNLSRPNETLPSGSEPPASQAPNIRIQPRPNVDARKREAPRSTSSVLDTRVATQSQPRAPTASELVEEMRRKRGQSPMR